MFTHTAIADSLTEIQMMQLTQSNPPAQHKSPNYTHLQTDAVTDHFFQPKYLIRQNLTPEMLRQTLHVPNSNKQH